MQAILGLKACEQLNVIQRVEGMSKTLHSECDVFVAYKDVFSPSSTGCLPITYHIEIDKNMKPVIHAPRQVPAALRPKIQEELDRMEKLGVVVPTTTPTEWVSSLVTVVKPNNEESSFLTCFNAPFGCYRFKRLPFGIKSAPEVYQRVMEELLGGI